MDEKFCLFLETVDDRYRDFVNQIHAYLTEKGCKCKIQTAKSGYTVSYVFNNNRTFATFLSRKTGMKLRIYPKQLQKYQGFLDSLPEKRTSLPTGRCQANPVPLKLDLKIQVAYSPQQSVFLEAGMTLVLADG